MATDFKAISAGIADVVANAANAVVRVDARRRYPASGVIWSADGLIVTASHVVRHEDNITVGLPGGDDVKATLVGRDPSTDLALLRVEATGLQTPSWVEEAEIRVGALVLAVGRPGANIEASLGVLSAVGGAWRTGGGGKVSHFIKPDLVMYPGFSGGALVGGNGGVVGIVSSALLRDSGVALPAPTVKPIVETLLAHGHMGRGYLGVGVQTVRLPAAVAEELDQKTGLLIISVENDSPAEAGDLLVGDILISLDDEPVRQPEDLSALLMGGRAGQTVNSRIVRGGVLQDRSLTVDQRS
ncbi:MAG: serine protease [Caldilineaceae bacterium]|nr:serine protease [Caldilineaceae bacterium]